MLNVFPELFFLAPLAALLIRAGTASAFALAAVVSWKRPESTTLKVLSVIEAATAIALAVGFYTQPAAILGILLIIVWFFNSNLRPVPISTALLLLIMSISLLITGAGPISFDLPL